MPAITYSDFSGGLDRRLPINVQDASRLWEMKNCKVTLGKRIAKREGLRKIRDGLSGSFGLEAVSGVLTVFASKGTSYVSPSTDINLVLLDLPIGFDADSLLDVSYADVFNGFPYVVGVYRDFFIPSGGGSPVEVREYRHHYVDTSPSTVIDDPNAPTAAPSVCKAASRVFAVAGEVVKYCKAGDPRDWTTASDAGFLPASLQQNTRASCTAVGAFANSLVIAFPEGLQIWTVAVDPSTNAISKRIDGVGCTQPFSLVPFASDLMFLSPWGFRSVAVQAVVDRIDDTDVGVAVDDLVVPDLSLIGINPVIGIWIHQFGQYWAVFNIGTSSKVWAYTYSKSSKVACWSEYAFPINILAITTSSGKVYLRDNDSLYEVAADQFTDDGVSIPVEVQMAFQNAKTPGVDKQWYGADFVFNGTADVSYKYDPRDQTKESISQQISGDTAPSQFVPVEIVSASIAPVIRHNADEAFEFTQTTAYFNPLVVT